MSSTSGGSHAIWTCVFDPCGDSVATISLVKNAPAGATPGLPDQDSALLDPAGGSAAVDGISPDGIGKTGFYDRYLKKIVEEAARIRELTDGFLKFAQIKPPHLYRKMEQPGIRGKSFSPSFPLQHPPLFCPVARIAAPNPF
ncbi:MAG TPA: hypothetical protein PKZ83_03250 [bacterium]|nr:hypothetical protein [bacterium]HQJ63122.1 hypothetical protein [bacterium]